MQINIVLKRMYIMRSYINLFKIQCIYESSFSYICNDRLHRKRSRTITFSTMLAYNLNVTRGNHATLAGGCCTMISDKKYSIPPGGMVLKDSLQLCNMWRSGHLSRKQTRRELRWPKRNNDTSRLDSHSSPCRFTMCERR